MGDICFCFPSLHPTVSPPTTCLEPTPSLFGPLTHKICSTYGQYTAYGRITDLPLALSSWLCKVSCGSTGLSLKVRSEEDYGYYEERQSEVEGASRRNSARGVSQTPQALCYCFSKATSCVSPHYQRYRSGATHGYSRHGCKAREILFY